MSVATQELYVALGDSTGVGVGARDGRSYVAHLHERLVRARPSVGLLNLCVSGATSRDLVAYQLPRAMAAEPALVTVLIGVNDLVRGSSPERFGENLERIASAIAARPATRALFCTLPDIAYAPAAGYFLPSLGIARSAFEARLRAFNVEITRRAAAHGHAVLDLYSAPLHDRAHFFSADGFHPSEHGYEELAERLWPAFRALALPDAEA